MTSDAFALGVREVDIGNLGRWALGSKAYMSYVVSLARAERASGVPALDISNRPEPSLTSLRTSTEHGGGLRRMDDKGVGVVQDDMSGGQLIAPGDVV